MLHSMEDSKKECALAHSRAEARLLRQPSTLAPSAHPRGAFLSYRNEVSYTIKKPACSPGSSVLANDRKSVSKIFLPPRNLDKRAVIS